MSETPGIRCDRCPARALLLEKSNGMSMPDGWGVVQVTRAQPFLKSTRDLCPTCIDEVLRVLRGKPT